MTRDELIEAMSQAIQNVPMVHTGTINVQGAIVADKRPPSVRIAAAVLKAIEAQGLAIVERRLVRAVAYEAAENLPRPTDGTATSMLLYGKRLTK